MKVVVVGYGMAGARLVAELHARDPECDITVLGAEPHRAYNRILLSNLLAGKAYEADMALAEPAGAGARVHLGAEVLDIDRTARRVSTPDGATFGYDKLVLATGGRAALPPIKGLAGTTAACRHRVAAFRTLDDCRRITRAGRRRRLRAGARRRAARAGGGPRSGRPGARGHRRARAEHLMDRQLDPAAGAVLAGTLAALGVRVEVSAATVAVESSPDRVEAVLRDGHRIAADLLVVACGVRAEHRPSRRAPGLAVDRGVLVDDRLRTSDPRRVSRSATAPSTTGWSPVSSRPPGSRPGWWPTWSPAPDRWPGTGRPRRSPDSRRPASTWPRWVTRRPPTATGSATSTRPGAPTPGW